LDEKEKRQAEQRALPRAIVVHEVVREEGEAELKRSFGGLAWSGLAAGLSIGFSFILEAYLQSALPDAPWRRSLSSFGYSLGFLIVVLGRQQLFTETTLTAVIPVLTRRDRATLLAMLRVWAVVLIANLVGTVIFGVIAAQPGVFSPEAADAMTKISDEAINVPFWQTVVRGGSAGWLIGLMVWLLPAAGSARPLIVIILTYVIALCRFPHTIAGSVEATFSVVTGRAPLAAYFTHFLAPTLIGNTVGGAALAALINHASVTDELKGAV
jgi:formate/nitrite transporter FocA (FNT family)